jgi:hypothetical protein
MTVGELVHFPKITWKLQQKKLKRGCAETKHQQNKKLSRFIWGKSSPKNETKKLKMGEDLAEMLKMIEKQAEKQTRQLEKQARDSEAWLENMIEKRHNELKGSIDDIKSEVILKMIEKHTNKQSQLFEKRLEKLKEIALQDERKTEIKHDMSEIQKTKSESESRKPKTKKPKNQKPKPKPNPKNQRPENQKTKNKETKKPKPKNQETKNPKNAEESL